VTDAWIKSSEQLAPRWCPSCARRLDAVTSATFGKKPGRAPVPKPGDVTICGYCSAVLVMTPDNFRVATQAEVDALPELTKWLAREWPVQRRGMRQR
jgi:hypothetical protein